MLQFSVHRARRVHRHRVGRQRVFRAAVSGCAVALVLALVGLLVPANPVSAAQDDPVLGVRALFLTLDIDQPAAPELFDALMVLESHILKLENAAAEWSEQVAASRTAIADLEAERDRAVIAAQALALLAAGEELTEVVIAARDQLATVEGTAELLERQVVVAQQALTADETVLDLRRSRLSASRTIRHELTLALTDQIARVRKAPVQADVGLPDGHLASQVDIAVRSIITSSVVEGNDELDGLAAAGIERVAPLISLVTENADDVGQVEQPEAMRWPTIGDVNSSFGMRLHPIYRSYRMHTGVDIDGAHGDPIISVDAGTVVSAGWQGGYGLTVEVDHGAGLTSLYSHMSELAVAEGDVVERGATVGQVGATGTATSAHLHFEIRYDDEPVDPLDYLP